MAIYQLGDYRFVTLHRVENPDAPPPIVQETTMPIERPGVDGSIVMRLGTRGSPFQMISGVDAENKSGADNAQDAYGRMVGFKRYDLIWANTNYTDAHQTKFIVLDVQVQRIKRLAIVVGGINAGGNFWVEVLWTLLPVPGT
jgi:hypothetical protein